MVTISVSAHFDGERILLDEPIELEPDTELIVTILPKDNEEREAWMALCVERLEDAYGENEDGYPVDSIKEVNPKYMRSVR